MTQTQTQLKLDLSYTKNGKWDYDKLLKETNLDLLELKKFLKKVRIKNLPESHIPIKPLQPLNLKTLEIIFKQHPKDPKLVAMLHLFLEFKGKWRLKSNSPVKVAIPQTPPPPLTLEPQPLTEVAAQSLKTSLTARHLNSRGHYNYELIQAELLATFDIWYRPEARDLMPKALIPTHISK